MRFHIGGSSVISAANICFRLCLTLVLFVGINLVAAHVQSDCGIAGALGIPFCNDDIRRLGFPLLVWEEGGFAYRNIFDVTALILDIGIGLSACTIMGLMGRLFVKRATHDQVATFSMQLLLVHLLLLLFPAVHSQAAVADNFHGVDFKNFSVPYRFSWGKHVNVRLKNGRYEYDFRTERGWFDLSQVYITDLTNDRRPEAIVMLSHVACGVSCDGGSALFYIYSFDNYRLKQLWQYETGDRAYGCGLKSFVAKRGTLTVELFGRCSRGNQTASSTGKFQVKDLTKVTFKSNGARFVVRKRKFFSSPERSVLNYEPQIIVAH